MDTYTKLKITVEVVAPFLLLFEALYLEVAQPYYVRGFFCDDQSLSYPFVESTVSNNAIYASGTVPLFFIFITCFTFLSVKQLYRLMVSYAFGVTILYVSMNIMKLFFGEFRPHFFSVCQPVWPGMNCSGYIMEFNCTGSISKRVIESQRSFPSSHAGITSFGMFYLIIFTQEVFMNKFKRFHLGWAIFQSVIFLWAIFAGTSRITDYKHHVRDVVAGYLLGLSFAYWVAYQWSGLREIGRAHEEEEENKVKMAATRHVIAHCTCQNGISTVKHKES